MTKPAPHAATSGALPANNENARPHISQPAHALKAGKPRAVAKKKRALADITNASHILPPSASASQPLKPVRERASHGGVLRLAAENARLSRARHAADRDFMQLDAGPQSPLICLRPRANVPAALLRGATLHCELRALPARVRDIDASDADDHLAEASLAVAVHANLLAREGRLRAEHGYMAHQRDITPKMRAILIDWLVDVHLKFELRPDTLHLTVNIIDRFLAAAPVLRKKLQLVGITAMLIASKYEEIYAPVVADFVYISDRTYCEQEILAMEAVVLNRLRFEVTVPYAATFLRRNLRAVRVCVGRDVPEVGFLAQYAVELALQEYAMLRFRQSQIAAAATLMAGKIVVEEFVWDETMQFHSGGWQSEALEECEMLLRGLLLNEQDPGNINKLTAIKRKYSADAYGDIATLVASVDLSMDDVCD